MNDREIRPREMMQMEVALGVSTNCIQCYQIISNGVLALLLNVWAKGSKRTIDDYVLSLYERLKEALPVARDSAIMEA